MVLERRLAKITRVVSQRQSGLVVVIEDVHDPHNAEAIFRTCDAFGVQEVYLVFDKTKPWNPAKIGKQSSSSAHKWLTFHTYRSMSECINELKKKDYFIVASCLDSQADSLLNTALPSRVALLIGNEHRGLSSEALDLADVKLTIPMRGMVESFNVSVASALFLFEITRQRLAGKRLPPLPVSEQEELKEQFIRRSSKAFRR